MRNSGLTPKRNAPLRKLRRDFGNRRWDRLLWVVWGGFWGCIVFFVGDYEDWRRVRSAEGRLRWKHHDETLDAASPSAPPTASPIPLDRREREDLHRGIRRRRLFRTTLVVFALMVIYYGAGWLRYRWLGG